MTAGETEDAYAQITTSTPVGRLASRRTYDTWVDRLQLTVLRRVAIMLRIPPTELGVQEKRHRSRQILCNGLV